MDLTTSAKGRGYLGMRVAPRCRGAASSLLRLSNAAPSALRPSSAQAFGNLGRADVSTVAQRLVQSLARLPLGASTASGPCHERSAPPLFTRLWPSAGFGRDALWQDTLVVLD